MARIHVGRHRAPGFSPLNEIVDIAAKTASPAVKVSAVAVASGGLVAAFALPAAAATTHDDSVATADGVASAAPQVSAPAVAVAAPAVDEALAPSFGIVGFTAKVAPPQAPAPIRISLIDVTPAPATPVAAATRASRTTTPRTAPVTTVTTVMPAVAPRAVVPAAPKTVAPAVPKAAAPAAAPAPAGAPASGIIGIAASLSGIPYVWGGTTTAGFDCSGYTGYVYRQVGKSLPRTAEDQRVASTKISNPVPGDLIFFGYPAYHVGIYAGSGKMYASSRPGTLTGLGVIWTQKDVSYGRF